MLPLTQRFAPMHGAESSRKCLLLAAMVRGRSFTAHTWNKHGSLLLLLRVMNNNF
jgi:hypothetical protein